MPKIVYLFGAGASANALPVVNQMPNRIREMIDKLPDLDAKDKTGQPCDSKGIQDLRDELKWLVDIIGDHATADELAKNLWNKQKFDDYRRLRFAIAAYFVLEQAYGSPDTRYRTLFTNLYDDRTRSLPNAISLLSWNYDSQFELAYHGMELPHGSSLKDIQLVLGLKNTSSIEDQFNILKLNGSALLTQENRHRDIMSVNPFWSAGDRNIANYTHFYYIQNQRSINVHCPLTFAWDNMTQDQSSLFSNIEARVKNAEILVTIGYSFPFFNKTIDKKIIESMLNLKKIYFQDVSPNAVIKAFRAISNKHFEKELVEDTRSFFLPPELE